jgi:hypothetical protein
VSDRAPRALNIVVTGRNDNYGGDFNESWGLRDAPARAFADDMTYLEFDGRAVAPLVEVRRIRLPMRHVVAAAG